MQVGELWVKLGLDKSNFNSGINDSKEQSSGLAGFIKNAFSITVGMGMFDLLKTGMKSAWDMLAKAMGVSTGEVMKLSEKGLIPADKAIGQLIDGMESRFPGMMNKQSQSFAGQMSTLKDNVQITLGGVLKPQFEYISSVLLPKAIEMTQKFAEAFKTGGLGAAMKTIIPAGLVDFDKCG